MGVHYEHTVRPYHGQPHTGQLVEGEPRTLVHYEQTVRGGTRGYTMSKQSGPATGSPMPASLSKVRRVMLGPSMSCSAILLANVRSPRNEKAMKQGLTPGLHPFTSQLNVSAFCGIGGASTG